ncbi:hypothetical protein [Ensifer adhaerens]|uniref:hypothetical protein n=1 Tax=Ensifer adhaerens TaxID=106592 RepID=UPI001146F820|nr:hypothetical protein [Ensifer adhaerens]
MAKNIESAFPGYIMADIPVEEGNEGTRAWTADRWQEEFSASRTRLKAFLDARDPYVILARTASRLLIETVQARPKIRRLEQAEVEFLQTLLLASEAPVLRVPTSPGNFVRLWQLVARNLRAFMLREDDRDGWERLGQRVRHHTLYYRNTMERSDCERLMSAILTRIDKQSREAMGFDISALYAAMTRLFEMVNDRQSTFMGKLGDLLHSHDRVKVNAAISFFKSAYPLAALVWRDSDKRYDDLQSLRYVAFQMSELAYPWIFTFSRQSLEEAFSPSIANELFSLAHDKGELAGGNPDHVYLNNPIWAKPYVRLPSDELFVPLPQLAYSFPFAIIERLIGERDGLKKAYENARAECLEIQIEHNVRTMLPSAEVYRAVQWDDPETGKTWENDIVARLGNFLFVFEAKSGRLHDIARRGGTRSLKTNFEDLYVEPGIQGWRLQNYIDTHGRNAVFRLKQDGSRVDFRLDKPKVVYRFSICIEHFAHLTSARHNLMALGLIEDNTAWAPVLSLGELGMIVRYLDSEGAAQHYLTRRATLEEVLAFEGDEQDLLSLYLTNGFWLDGAALDGQFLRFFEADIPVRIPKTPRENRRTFETPVPLSPLWQAICRELYQDVENRHRFDLINVILNQSPPTLAEIERRVRKYRRGVPHRGEDAISVRIHVGNRVFVLACLLAKTLPDQQEWPEFGRSMVLPFLQEDNTVDCASFVFGRRSKESGSDGYSFLRAGLARKRSPLMDTFGLSEENYSGDTGDE